MSHNTAMHCWWILLLCSVFVPLTTGMLSQCDTLSQWIQAHRHGNARIPTTVADMDHTFALVGSLVRHGVLSANDVMDALEPLLLSIEQHTWLISHCSASHSRPSVPVAHANLTTIHSSQYHDAVGLRRASKWHLHAEHYTPEMVHSAGPPWSPRHRLSRAAERPQVFAAGPLQSFPSFSGTSSLADCRVLVELNNSTQGTAFPNASCLANCCTCPGVECSDAGHVQLLSVHPAAGFITASVWQLLSLETLRIVGKEYGNSSDVELLRFVAENAPRMTSVAGDFSFPVVFPSNLTTLVIYGSFTGLLPSALPMQMRAVQLVGMFSGVVSASVIMKVSYSLQLVGRFSAPLPVTEMQPTLKYLSIHGCSGGTLDVRSSFSSQLVVIDLYGNALSGTVPLSFGSLTQLQALNLGSNQLSGVLPESLGNLTHLQHLVLSLNQLTGPIPESFGNLIQLQYLDVRSNQLSGVIPQSLGNLAQLTTLSLGLNQLTGLIPETLGNLGELQTMFLYSNQLSGPIPKSLGKLSKLQYMFLCSNQLTGAIPESLGNVVQLQYLYLYSNQLSGPIPESLGKLAQLQSLHLYSNHLTGPIPESLGNLSKLQYLWLFSNQLIGEIPESLGNLAELRYLDLDSNQLSGPLPESLGNLAQLHNLEVDSNQLTGPIPESLGRLSKLQYLRLNYNQLTGAIPESLGNLAQLQDLDLHSNQLTGGIPELLGNLAQLQSLRLYSNQLSGPIPEVLGKLAQLRTLNLGWNQLTGAIPQSLGRLARLKDLELYSNQLSGPIPQSLGNLAHLQYLVLYSNQLNGLIPASLGNLLQLELLDLSSNALSGPIPDSFGNLSRLKYLVLDRNRIQGPIPSSLCLLSSLQLFYGSTNNITAFPPCYLSNLTVLSLSLNRLVYFPFGLLTNFSSLVSLDLSGNLLSGPFPVNVFMGGFALRVLSLADNVFQGPLPIYPCGYYDERGEFVQFHADSSLVSVDLSGNTILGAPGIVDVVRCTQCASQYLSLTTLRLSNASIQSFTPPLTRNLCTIPALPFTQIFKSLSALVSLDLSWNNISMALDPIFNSLPLLSTVDLRGNLHANRRVSLAPSNYNIFAFTATTAFPVNASTTCYSAHLPLSRLSVLADPSFFDYSNCVCRSGFFGKPNQCRACAGMLDHAQCSFPSDSLPSTLDPRSARNLSGNVIALDGYFASPSVTYDDMYYNRSYPLSIELCANAGTDLTPCKPSQQGPCADGYEGRLCSDCADGYFHTGDACTTCPSGPWLVLFEITFLLVVVGLVFWSFFVGSAASGFAKILVLFLQCLFYVRPAMPPSLYSFTHRSSSLAMLSLDGPKCMFSSWTYENRYTAAIVMALSLPLSSFVIFAIGLPVIRLRGQSRSAASMWLDRCRRSALFLAVFLYMPAVNAILAPLACVDDVGDRHAYLVSVPYVRCSQTLRTWSIALLVLYVAGFPALCSLLVYHSRVLMQDEQVQSRRRYLYSLLFGSYRQTCFAWELVVTTRRIMLIAAFATVSRLSAIQTLLVALALGGSLVLTVIVAPYRSRSENAFEGATLTVLLANYAVELKAQILGVNDVNTAGTFVFILDIAIVVAGILCLLPVLGRQLLRFWRLFRPPKFQITTPNIKSIDGDLQRALLENENL